MKMHFTDPSLRTSWKGGCGTVAKTLILQTDWLSLVSNKKIFENLCWPNWLRSVLNKDGDNRQEI